MRGTLICAPLAGFAAAAPAADRQVNPSAEHVHELALADVVVPPRRLRHPLGPDRDLGADLPAARGRDAEVAALPRIILDLFAVASSWWLNAYEDSRRGLLAV
jgi:hypothetical protein